MSREKSNNNKKENKRTGKNITTIYAMASSLSIYWKDQCKRWSYKDCKNKKIDIIIYVDRWKSDDIVSSMSK